MRDQPFELIAARLDEIEAHLRRVEAAEQTALARVHPAAKMSARNLIHYVALRQLDLRELQLLLQQRGLSSLGRAESVALGSVLEVALRVAESRCVAGSAMKRQLRTLERRRSQELTWETAEYLLHKHTREVLGPRPGGRHVYVMVTAPDAKEADAKWMARLLRAGMNVLRINCAHGTTEDWEQMVAALEEARRATGADCRVLMDLAGPKIRTGPIAGGQRVVTWKIVRNEIGQMVEPARVVLHRASAPDVFDAPVLLLGDEDHDAILEGDEIHFADTRGRRRKLSISREDDRLVGTCDRRAWVVGGMPFVVVRRGRVVGKERQWLVGGPIDAAIELRVGDPLLLTSRRVAGRPAKRGSNGRVSSSAIVSCTVPEALSNVGVGQRVLFDDGKIETTVEQVTRQGLRLRVVRALRSPIKLRADKGINLPESELPVASLTAEDLKNLAFVARRADLVGMSFVRAPADVRSLHAALAALGRDDIGIVLKIETRRGFENLPRILLEAMKRPPFGVMIARGDLAVEVGFERLAELQEEILWLCEASHVPAVWATQVLDGLARTGIPTRAEVTDAAASVAAECVMLNKGPFVAEAVETLVDILGRMEKHRYKKRSIFRRLKVSTLG